MLQIFCILCSWFIAPQINNKKLVLAQDRAKNNDAVKHNYFPVAKCLHTRHFHLTTTKHVMSQKSPANTPGRVARANLS